LNADTLKGLLNPRGWPFWLIILLLIYTLGGFFGLPWLLRKQATDRVQEAGRSLAVEQVRVNPFTLVIEVNGLELTDEDGVPLVSWDHYLWNFQTSSLFRWAWTFKEIRLDGLYLNMERYSPDDQRLGRFLDSFGPEAEPEPEPSEEPGIPRLLIHKLSLADARLEWTDHLVNPPFSTLLGPISVEVHDLSTLPDDTGRQRVEVRNQSGGVLSWSGSVEFSPLRSQGDFSIRGEAFDDLFEYAGRHVPFESDIGAASIDFHYELHLDDNQELELSVSRLMGEVNGLQIKQPGVDGPVVSIPAINLVNGGMRWPAQELSADEVSLSGLEVNAWLEPDGEISLMALVPETDQGEAAGTNPDAGQDSGQPWILGLSSFSVNEGKIQLQDRSLESAPTFNLTGLKVEINEINLEDGALFPTRAGIDIASGGRVDFDGRVGLFPDFNAAGSFRLKEFTLAALQDYAAQSARIEIQHGTLDLAGDVTSNATETLGYAGSVRVTALDILDGVLQEQLIALESMVIDRAEVGLSANSANLSVVELRAPAGRIHIAEDLTTNVGDLVIEPEVGEAEVEDDAAAQTSAPAVTVAGIEFESGQLDFSDFSLPLPFETRISSLNGTISTLASQSSEPASVNLEGQVNEFGQARIEGTISAWAPTQNTDIALTFRNLEIARLSPYTIQFAGYKIAEGRMDLDLEYKLTNEQLEGSNAIVMRELTLGEKVEHPDAASLPLGLAIALLKDSQGVIDIDLPVSGNLDDPEFSYGSVIAQALFNLITKVVTAPFRLLGNLVGIDSEDFGTLEFQPGDAEVSPPDREKLVKLSEAMAMRPELVLEVGGVFSESLDRQALRQLQVEARIAEREQPGDEFSRNVIEELFAESFPGADLVGLQAEFTPPVEEGSDDAPQLDQLAYVNELKRRMIDNEPVSDEQLVQLAQQRGEGVLAVIMGESAEMPENIRAGAPEPVEDDSESSVRMELKVSIEK
jgi:hypothetical protein